MSETLAGGLPGPEQMRNLRAAERAVALARRMREASRAVVLGNAAGGVALMGVALSFLHSDWAKDVQPFILCGLVYGWIALAAVSLRWAKRRHAADPVAVSTLQEAAVCRTPPRPAARVAILLTMVVVYGLATAGWLMAFRHLSQGAILASLAVGPAAAAAFFGWRFARFGLGEDLLFAAAVVLAHAPFFLRQPSLTGWSFLSLPLVVIGTVSLHRRWARWAGSLSDEETAQSEHGVRP